MKKVYVYITLAILLLSTLGLASISLAGAAGEDKVSVNDQSRTSARKQTDYITKFNTGSSSVDLDFGSTGGTNTDVNVTIPTRSKVLSAQMDIEGKGGLTYYDFDYNDTVNHSAYHGRISLLPPTLAPGSYEGTAFVAKEYTAIQNIDNSRAEHSYNSNNTGREYHLFKFNVSSAVSPAKFQFYWVGQSYVRNSLGLIQNGFTIYMFCAQNSTWVKLDYQLSAHTSQIQTIKSSKEVLSAANYKDPVTSLVYVMVATPQINPMAVDSGSIGTDYTKLFAYTSGLVFPADVGLDVGSDGDTEWNIAGPFSSKVTLGDTQGLKAELQEHIDAAGTDEGTLDVVFKVTSGSEGRVQLANLNITLEVLEHNEPPSEVLGQLIQFYMTEDDTGSGDNLVDLSAAFEDDHDTSSTLIYEITDAGSQESLEAVLDADGHNVDFIPAQDFFGTVMFRVSATDSGADEVPDTFDDLMSFSRFFNITVEPVNDAPVLNTASEQLAVNESETLLVQVTVSDIDDEIFTWDSNLTDKVDVIPDTENSSLAEVSFEHDGSDVGKQHHFYVKIWDSGGSEGENFIISDSINISVDVINLNNAPKFVRLNVLPDEYSEPIVDGSTNILKNENEALEDELYEISFEAADSDIGIDPLEVLTFSISADGAVDGELSIDAETGRLSFLPTNADVGTVRFNVTVTDRLGETDEAYIELHVKNVNDAPMNVRIIQPELREFNTTEKINFKGEAFDDDLDIWNTQEWLTFAWFTNRSTAALGSGDVLNDMSLDPGWHNITLKVTDNAGETAYDYIELLIIAPIDPGEDPDDKDDPDKDKDNDTDTKDDGLNDPKTKSTGDEKLSSSFFMALMAVIIAAVVAILIIFSLIRKKKGSEPEDDEGEQSGQPGAVMPGQLQNGLNGQMYQMPYGLQQPYPGLQQMQMPVQYPQAPVTSFQQPLTEPQGVEQVTALPAAEVQEVQEAVHTEPGPVHVEGQTPSAESLENIDKQDLQSTKPVSK